MCVCVCVCVVATDPGLENNFENVDEYKGICDRGSKLWGEEENTVSTHVFAPPFCPKIEHQN